MPIQMKKLQYLFVIMMGLIIFTLYKAFIEEPVITPSHVYQQTQSIVANLDRFTKVRHVRMNINIYTPSHRKPRHVMQKARELLTRIDRYKKLLNMEGVDYPVIPVKNVEPENVMVLVKILREEVSQLQPYYGIKTDLKETRFKPEMTPSDVYTSLNVAGAYLDALFAPVLEPSDVYQIVQTIVKDLEMICLSMNDSCSHYSAERIDNLIPKDVFEHTLKLYEKVKSLAEIVSKTHDEKIEISIPDNAPSVVEPANVMNLMNNLQADIIAIKYMMGLRTPSTIKERQQNIEPSDVHMQVSKAIMIVDKALLEHAE